MNIKLLAAAACLLAMPTSAATTVKNFRAVANFSEGPYRQITLSFGLSFDPMQDNASERPLLSFTSSVADPAFIGQVLFNNYYDAISIGKPEDGVEGVYSENDDFNLTFFTGRPGGDGVLFYNNSRFPDGYFADTVTVSEVTAPAVPEPATWGTLVLGFGIVGAGLRYRQRKASISFG